ncbi:uncharacterized protein A4U43_C05F1390 [Asparagus officinalis]|uniref:BHLH domain-containing protein n=1 Tax=Asparagus officinalis TaxID=4686 RepID=A0A5P1ENI9_ASPOF|nr:transcription factor SPEECHLESS [Asparagus officinalis]ONK67568.1 uncharacterized protein A4U43_C05F1390 [Asparagus officinalis]
MAEGLSEFFEAVEFRSTNLTGAASPENLFSMFETFEDATTDLITLAPFEEEPNLSPKETQKTQSSPTLKRSNTLKLRLDEVDEDGGDEASLARKKLKFAAAVSLEEEVQDGQQKVSHITVERNRRKQMNEHLSVLRSLMPCFYVKRGDQASIIGGVVDYIKELQQVLQSLEAKKQRKAYTEVLSPRPTISSPRPPQLPLSPRPSPLSPRIGLPISPRTPQPSSPYKLPIRVSPIHESSSSLDTASSINNSGELAAAANFKSPLADVEVKFSGPNVMVNTVSSRIPGQMTKIVAALEGHSLEILQLNINNIDDTMMNSFTIKIGIECELSAEELAQEILQTFS